MNPIFNFLSWNLKLKELWSVAGVAAAEKGFENGGYTRGKEFSFKVMFSSLPCVPFLSPVESHNEQTNNGHF